MNINLHFCKDRWTRLIFLLPFLKFTIYSPEWCRNNQREREKKKKNNSYSIIILIENRSSWIKTANYVASILHRGLCRSLYYIMAIRLCNEPFQPGEVQKMYLIKKWFGRKYSETIVSSWLAYWTEAAWWVKNMHGKVWHSWVYVCVAKFLG